MRRSTWICLDDCQAPFVAHLQSPWGASGKPRSWRRRFPDKRYRGPTGATRSTVYPPLSPRSPSTALHLRCGDRDRDWDRGRGGVTTATMPGETSDGGGEDINGGQGRHIESLSLIFAQRRCEFFLLARKVAAQGCVWDSRSWRSFRGYRWHASTETVRCSRGRLLGIMVNAMRVYAARKRFTETCGNRACTVARRWSVLVIGREAKCTPRTLTAVCGVRHVIVRKR